MQKKTATELLKIMIPLLISYLKELSNATALEKNQFLHGEQTAYTECLEWLQLWEFSESFGLDFNVEQRFPL